MLRRVALDTMTAIYDRRAGVTHLVAAPVPEILKALQASALDLYALAAALDAQTEITALSERLDELVATGLVERA